ncbi:MAG: arylsulfotransferase (ASST) [Chloroflexi bacterium]|nr:arylsulfotransferase (ASST) [Chloroflexota bacterium]
MKITTLFHKKQQAIILISLILLPILAFALFVQKSASANNAAHPAADNGQSACSDDDSSGTTCSSDGGATNIDNYVRGGDTGNAANTAEENDAYLPLILNNTSTADTPESGYNLFAPLGGTAAYLIDEEGNTVFTWSSAYWPGNAVYLLENGNLLRAGKTNSANFNTGGVGGIVEEISSDGTVVWSFEHDTAQGRLHHDIELLPNGNVLMLAWERKTESEAIAAGCNPNLLSDGELWPDSIIEVDPNTNNIVWEWRVWDHLVQDYDANQANYGVVADHPELIDLNYRGAGTKPGSADWNHINAIDYNAEFDQILLSVRNFSEIWIIDHSAATAEAVGHSGGNSGMGGDLLYRWGNPQTYDYGDANDQQLFVQHDAQWIPADYPGAGNILVFNNGNGRSDGDYSSVDEIAPPVDETGNYNGYGPTSSEWTYTADTPTDFYAANISGAQRLANGNTLICDGPNGYFFEVTEAGDLVWEYDHGNQAIFRVTRYESDYSGLPPINQ